MRSSACQCLQPRRRQRVQLQCRLLLLHVPGSRVDSSSLLGVPTGLVLGAQRHSVYPLQERHHAGQFHEHGAVELLVLPRLLSAIEYIGVRPVPGRQLVRGLPGHDAPPVQARLHHKLAGWSRLASRLHLFSGLLWHQCLAAVQRVSRRLVVPGGQSELDDAVSWQQHVASRQQQHQQVLVRAWVLGRVG